MQCLLEGIDSLAIGRSCVCKPTGLRPVADRFAGKPCLGEMMSQHLGLGGHDIRKLLFEYSGNTAMELPPPALEHRDIGGVLYQRVLELIRGIGRNTLL